MLRKVVGRALQKATGRVDRLRSGGREPVAPPPPPKREPAAPPPSPKVVVAPAPTAAPEAVVDPAPIAAPEVAVAPAPVPAAEPPTPAIGLGIAGLIAAGRLEAEDDPSAPAGVAFTSGEIGPNDDVLHHGSDGIPYWGPIDNESARARARGELLVIDQVECINCGTCVENTDRVFQLPDDAKAVVVAQEGNMALIQDAIDACPVTCIHWTEEPEAFPQLNDAQGRSLS